MVEKRKAYKLNLEVYVPPEDSKDPVIVEIARRKRGIDLCVDGKDIIEALEYAGGVIVGHIEYAKEYDVDIWKGVEFIEQEDWDRFMEGEDL